MSTLAAGAVFKLSAFAREAFIASRFGLSAVTDAYFALQQLPLTLATFMFGAFALAFTPAYAHSTRKSGRAEWLPGLLLYGLFTGLSLTVLTFFASQLLLKAFTTSPQHATKSTLNVLSFCYVPIIAIGICSGICTSYGKNVWALTLTGLPYLVMTVTLMLMYAAGSLGDLSLPISMTSGFVIVGLVSAFLIFRNEKPQGSLNHFFQPWRSREFRLFLRQLTASSVESVGFTGNQFFLLHFLSLCGVGAISANNCASRIGMLGYSLFAQPLGQYLQGRMCITSEEDRRNQFQRFLLTMALGSASIALVTCLLRYPVAQLIYMRGKFSATALDQVADLLPAWLAYFVVLALNSCAAKYLFVSSRGMSYSRNMLCGYALTNALRMGLAGRFSPAYMIWSAVFGEGMALLINLKVCFGHRDSEAPTPFAAVPEMQQT